MTNSQFICLLKNLLSTFGGKKDKYILPLYSFSWFHVIISPLHWGFSAIARCSTSNLVNILYFPNIFSSMCRNASQISNPQSACLPAAAVTAPHKSLLSPTGGIRRFCPSHNRDLRPWWLKTVCKQSGRFRLYKYTQHTRQNTPIKFHDILLFFAIWDWMNGSWDFGWAGHFYVCTYMQRETKFNFFILRWCWSASCSPNWKNLFIMAQKYYLLVHQIK